MSFIHENVKNWLWREILQSGDPFLFYLAVGKAYREIEEEIQDMDDWDFERKAEELF